MNKALLNLLVSIGVLSFVLLLRDDESVDHDAEDIVIKDWWSATSMMAKGWQRLGVGIGNRANPRNDLRDLQESLNAAHLLLRDDIRYWYGPYGDVIFNGTEIVTEIMQSPSALSIDRIKRRMKRKIIEAYLERQKPPSKRDNITYTWVTGGNSIAAGHGNLMSQSYTAVVDRALEPVFAALGVQFQTKLRAYSGARSAPEISLCIDALFGNDIDLLAWDYGMTDGGRTADVWMYRFFANRAGLLPTSPGILMMGGAAQRDIHDELEKQGQAVISVGDVGALKQRMPDSTTANPDSLPPALRYYICKGQAENNPPCNEADIKFNTTECHGDVRGKTGWHSGWKENMFRGYLYATFLANLLRDSVEELLENDSIGQPSLRKEALSEFVEDEAADKAIFLQSFPQRNGQSFDNITENVWPLLLRGNARCHSMIQPSQARCDGLVDGIEATTTDRFGYCANKDHYSMNPSTLVLTKLPATDKRNESETTPWMVASDTWFRQGCGNTSSIIVNHDHADSFVVRYEDGWMHDLYPNNVTLMKYSPETERKGVVIICFRNYPFLKLPVSSFTVGTKQANEPDLGIPTRKKHMSNPYNMQRASPQWTLPPSPLLRKTS